MVKYDGLTKAEALVELYNFAQYDTKHIDINKLDISDLTLKEAKQILNTSLHIERVKGKMIFVYFTDNEFDNVFYDAINGKGVAQRAIDNGVVEKFRKEQYSVD